MCPGLVSKRMDHLKQELSALQYLTLDNNSIRRSLADRTEGPVEIKDIKSISGKVLYYQVRIKDPVKIPYIAPHVPLSVRCQGRIRRGM